MTTRISARFAALDGWRGLCACMVAVYHLNAFSHVMLWPIVRHAYLFVDFFFVLSGFVIAGRYRDKLAQGFGAGRFLFLRWGRIYPLHAVMLLLFIPIDMAKNGGGGAPLPQAVVTNLLLLHGLGVNDDTWLNFPSWSISSEFATYIAFALVASASRTVFWASLVAAIVVCPVVIELFSPRGMNTTYDYGFVRCLFGFALGAICFEIRTRFVWTTLARTRAVQNAIEIAAVGLTIGIVTVAGEGNSFGIAGPVVFAVVVLVFAEERGLVSGLLVTRPLILLGTLSYSIYMVHALVRAIIRALGLVAHRLTGAPSFTPVRLDGVSFDMLGTHLWQGDLAQVAMLAGTIGLAVLTFRYIEEPGRRWSRRVVLRKTANISMATEQA